MWGKKETNFSSTNSSKTALTYQNTLKQKERTGFTDSFRTTQSRYNVDGNKDYSNEIVTEMREVLKVLVDSPDEIKIETNEIDGSLMLHVWVAKEDTGKIIGKQGKMADALRTILITISSKRRVKAMLSIEQ